MSDSVKAEPDTSLEDLRAKLKAVTAIQNTVIAIFALIILAWLVLGYWRTNLPVFISTVAMACAIGAMQFTIRSGLARKLKERGGDEA